MKKKTQREIKPLNSQRTGEISRVGVGDEKFAVKRFVERAWNKNDPNLLAGNIGTKQTY